MSRYIHVMTRDEMVAEIRDLMLWGVAHPHEVPDPTILPPSRLRPLLMRLRLKALTWGAQPSTD
jgi:hypothetical protein